ncbi:MAG: hypothetical protein HN413_15765 [Chloroflexi bacterium]|nr:hypothetical protein [Chloroflexota bacterium]
MTALLNLNTASAEELTSLPGVGPAIAERIVAARPFVDANELQTIEGIGAALFDRLVPLVEIAGDDIAPEAEPLEETPATPEEAPPPEAETDALEVDAEIPTDGLAPEEPAAPSIPPEEKPKTSITRGQALLMSLGSSFLAFVLAAALVFGVLVGLNGGLRFVSPAELAQLERQIEGMQVQLDITTQDIEGLRARLDNLEDVSQQVAQLSDDVAAVNAQADALSSDVEALQAESAQFEDFFTALRALLNDLFGADAP